MYEAFMLFYPQKNEALYPGRTLKKFEFNSVNNINLHTSIVYYLPNAKCVVMNRS